MKTYKFNKRDTRFAPWAALCVLSLVGAMVFAAPSVVFAQVTGELSQDCETAMVGTQHTITAKVTDGDVPVAGAVLMFMVQGTNFGMYPGKVTNQNGVAEFMYTGAKGLDTILLTLMGNPNVLATINTEWTEEDLCSESKSPSVTVGGRLTLNPKKHGALNIAVCGTDEFDVSNVNPTTVLLAGVAPWHWKQKDSRLCPDGKDGFVDLVLKFKNRDVVEALGLLEEDVDEVPPLVLEGDLYDGTAFGGEWAADIKKNDKRHGKKNHHQKNHKKDKGSKK